MVIHLAAFFHGGERFRAKLEFVWLGAQRMSTRSDKLCSLTV